MTLLEPTIRRGALIGGLCLALTAAPVFAHPHDDDESDNSKSRKEIRVFIPDDEEDGEEAVVRGAYLGVQVQDISRDLQEAKELPTRDGALVNRVERESPAAKGGIQRGDVILEINKHKVDDAGELIRQMRLLEPDAKVPVVVYRDGGRKNLTVTLGKRPRSMVMEAPHFRGHWVDRWSSDMPELSEQLDQVRVYRKDIQRQLDDIQDQLRDLQRLEEDIRALREELRESRDRSRSSD